MRQAPESDAWAISDLPSSPPTKFDGRICGEAEFKVSRTLTDMVIVLDRSNSMSEGKPSLWETCRNTIYDVTAATDGNIWFGLFTFPNSVGLTACGPFMMVAMCLAPSVPVVGVAAGNSGAIKSALTTMGVCGGKPTAQTLTAVKKYLTHLPSNNHPRYVLLVTCTFEIDCSKIQKSSLVNFYFDGKAVPRKTSHTSGWDWTTECKGQTGKGVVAPRGTDPGQPWTALASLDWTALDRRDLAGAGSSWYRPGHRPVGGFMLGIAELVIIVVILGIVVGVPLTVLLILRAKRRRRVQGGRG